MTLENNKGTTKDHPTFEKSQPAQKSINRADKSIVESDNSDKKSLKKFNEYHQRHLSLYIKQN